MLPQGWAASPIGDLCNLINGKAFKPSDWAATGLPIIRIQNLNRPDADFNYCNTDVDNRFIVQPGELLFAWSGTPGTSFGAHVWNGPKAVLNQHIFRVRFNEAEIDRDYLKRAINSTLGELIRKAHGGVGLAHVTKGKFEATEIPFPPAAEQRRIVAKLDALTSRLNRARAEMDRVPVLAAKLREAAVETTLGGNGNRRAGWLLTNLGDLATEGPTNGWSPKSDAGANGALTLKLTATTSGRLRLDEQATKRIYDTPPQGSKFWLRNGDLLVQRANALEHIGATAIFVGPPQTYIYPDLMMRLRFEDPHLARVVWFRLNSPTTRRYLRARATGTAGNMPKISGAVLRALPIALPKPSDWGDIIARMDAAFACADRLEAEAARARALIDRLEAAILARAFRGELVPQDPADEPASVLLDRIRAQRAAAPKPKRGWRASSPASAGA